MNDIQHDIIIQRHVDICFTDFLNATPCHAMPRMSHQHKNSNDIFDSLFWPNYTPKDHYHVRIVEHCAFHTTNRRASNRFDVGPNDFSFTFQLIFNQNTYCKLVLYVFDMLLTSIWVVEIQP